MVICTYLLFMYPPPPFISRNLFYSLIYSLCFLFELFSFDTVELLSDITMTVLVTIDIGTKLNGTVET